LRRVALLTGLVLLGSLAAGGATAAPVAILPAQQLVTLLANHEVHNWPSATSGSQPLISVERPLTGVNTVLPVLARTKSWLKVRLPGRPNSHTGWIRRKAIKFSWTPWHLVVSTGQRRVFAYQKGRLVKSFPAVVGKPSTPTPTGEFFVEEAIRLTPGGPGSPYAMALSARSNVYQEFEGGPGQIALHGITGIGGVPGTAVSHGCIRLDSYAITWLISHFGAGTPVTITS
jgi:hypothetical protein